MLGFLVVVGINSASQKAWAKFYIFNILRAFSPSLLSKALISFFTIFNRFSEKAINSILDKNRLGLVDDPEWQVDFLLGLLGFGLRYFENV